MLLTGLHSQRVERAQVRSNKSQVVVGVPRGRGLVVEGRVGIGRGPGGIGPGGRKVIVGQDDFSVRRSSRDLTNPISLNHHQPLTKE